MNYYLMYDDNLVAFVPDDATTKTLDLCERMRNGEIQEFAIDDILVDRALGVVDGGLTLSR